MHTSLREHLPLVPLLHAYTRASLLSPAELHRLPDLGPRFAAILSASVKFLYADFIDRAPDGDFAEALGRFYQATVQPPLHANTLRRRAGIVRHGIASLLRGCDPLPLKAESCLSATGPYHVAGLGPAFWSALVQGLQPAHHPGWTSATLLGLRRLGLASWDAGAGPGDVYAVLLAAYARIRSVAPQLSALHVDHFLSLVASMRGRNLWDGGPPQTAEGGCLGAVKAALARVRAEMPLRDRLKERGAALAEGQERLQTALAQCDGKALGAALAAADLAGSGRAPLDWSAYAETLTFWVGRLWEAEDPYPVLAEFWQSEPLPGAALWLPGAVLHLRDPQRFQPWSEDVRFGYASLDDSARGDVPAVESYRLFNEGVLWLREHYQIHPLEMPAVLSAVAALERETPSPACSALCTPRSSIATFGGFCADTFEFLTELAANNGRPWMEQQRDRYRFAVREPLGELCEALTSRYVEPVLRGVHGWPLDTRARTGRALTSVCKNAYGRTRPYNTTLWIAFCRRSEAGRRDAVQFFVRLDASGLRYGVRLGRKGRAAARLLQNNLKQHADHLFEVLHDNAALGECRVGRADSPLTERIASGEELRRLKGSFAIGRCLAANDPLLTRDELVGDILLTFDRLVPLYACAVEEDPRPFLALRGTPAGERFTEADFQRATFLGPDWLRRAQGLLGLKRQLILQGVPGTGKTHVARCLARLLTAGREDRMRLVQFHPAYSYEEFVEGIKVRSVETNGRHDVTYPVEDGLLCDFAARATASPSEPHVLVIDEINRGNLPRIFGELLYLLEYRDQVIGLPYSRRGFRLPANLYLIGTMNAADRSVALIDQALRRRFSFLEMPPDSSILAAWLAVHVPAAGRAFADRVLSLFQRLNARLAADLGPQGQVGHSYFMVPDLDEPRLRMVWQHHLRPLLEEHFAGQPSRLAAYDLDELLNGPSRRPMSRRREKAGV
jgi:hypothetical protein